MRPFRGRERPLGVHGGVDRRAGVGERGEEGVALRAVDVAAVPLDRVTHDRVKMRGEQIEPAGTRLPRERRVEDSTSVNSRAIVPAGGSAMAGTLE